MATRDSTKLQNDSSIIESSQKGPPQKRAVPIEWPDFRSTCAVRVEWVFVPLFSANRSPKKHPSRGCHRSLAGGQSTKLQFSRAHRALKSMLPRAPSWEPKQIGLGNLKLPSKQLFLMTWWFKHSLCARNIDSPKSGWNMWTLQMCAKMPSLITWILSPATTSARPLKALAKGRGARKPLLDFLSRKVTTQWIRYDTVISLYPAAMYWSFVPKELALDESPLLDVRERASKNHTL